MHYLILCIITNDYKCTFAFKYGLECSFEGWVNLCFELSRDEFIHDIVSLFIGEWYNFVQNYKYIPTNFTQLTHKYYRGNIVFPPLFVLNKSCESSSSLLRISKPSTWSACFGTHLRNTSAQTKLHSPQGFSFLIHSYSLRRLASLIPYTIPETHLTSQLCDKGFWGSLSI